LILIYTQSYSQVGVGTTDPKATFQVIGSPSSTVVADGIIAPRISRANLIAKTAYSSNQIGAIIYVSDLSGTVNSATQNIIEIGYYNFNGTRWESMNSNSSKFHYGDIKQGFQATDHSGWIKLNGRAKTSLTATQQTQATTLGIGINLPDASNAFLVQNGTTIGNVSSSNTKTIVQANLPNITLGGTAYSAGSHTHTTNVNDNNAIFSNGATAMKEAQLNWTSGASASNPTVMASSGDHTHSITTNSINGGVTQTSLDITPRSLSVNTFIYLGN
jgi:hypothetical protein